MLNNIIKKLLSAKFITTLSIIGTTCYLAIKESIPSEQFLPLATMVVGFYFAQSVARGGKNE